MTSRLVLFLIAYTLVSFAFGVFVGKAIKKMRGD